MVLALIFAFIIYVALVLAVTHLPAVAGYIVIGALSWVSYDLGVWAANRMSSTRYTFIPKQR